MPEKDPTNWAIGTWLLVLGMSLLGGISSWYQRVKAGHTRAFNVIELVGEVTVSGLLGLLGFLVGLYFFASENLAASLAGMSAHFSTRILFQAEGILDHLAKAINRKIDLM